MSVRCKLGTKTTLSTLSLWITASCQSSEKCTYSFWYSGEMIYPVAGTKILNFMSCIKGKSLKNKFTPYSNFCISQSGPSFLLTYIYKTCRAVYYIRYWFPNIPYRTYLFCQNVFPLNGTNFSQKSETCPLTSWRGSHIMYQRVREEQYSIIFPATGCFCQVFIQPRFFSSHRIYWPISDLRLEREWVYWEHWKFWGRIILK